MMLFEDAKKYKILLPLRGSGAHAIYKIVNFVSDLYKKYYRTMAVPNGSVDTISWIMDLSIIKGIRYRNALPIVTVRSFVVTVLKAIQLSYLKNKQILSVIGSDSIFV
jgi:hypothetical protein